MPRIIATILSAMACTAPALAADAAKKPSAQPSPTAAAGSAFDPHGYITNKEEQKTNAAEKLQSQGIVRLNGQRYLRVDSPEGAVFLPFAGSVPEFRQDQALCEQHLKLLDEVLPVREKLPIDDGVKKHEHELIAMIRKCVEGRVSGPTAVETAPDGAVIEAKAKEKRAPEARGGDGKPASDK